MAIETRQPRLSTTKDFGLRPKKVWRGSATTVSGVATFDLSSAGFASVMGALPVAIANVASAVTAPLASLKTLSTTQCTVNVVRGRTLSALGDTLAFIADGTTVYLEVWGD